MGHRNQGKKLKQIVSGIYCITNTLNGKKYIGQSINIYNRMYVHKHHAIKMTHRKSHLYSAMRKYGFRNFIFDIILLEDDLSLLNEIEIELIKTLNLTNPDFGYNTLTGGENSLHTEETKRKIGQTKIGKPRPKWIIDNLAKINRGRKHSKETKELYKSQRKYFSYSVISPEGIIYKTENLNDFCKEHDLLATVLYQVSKETPKRKHYKGWTATRVPIAPTQ